MAGKSREVKESTTLLMQKFEAEERSENKLKGDGALLFKIPLPLISDVSLECRRVTSFSYLVVNRSMTGRTMFSISDMVKWVGKKQDGSSNGINSKFSKSVKLLEEKGYVELLGKLGNSNSLSSAVVNVDMIEKMCDEERFATIYLDELNKIMGYKNDNARDRHMSNESVLMVFAYLRAKIYMRRNTLIAGECGVEERRLRSPDAYDCYYQDIADSLGLSERVVSKAVDVLNDLELIYSETLPRTKSGDKWVTNTTIFCNRYKRQNGYLLESGKEYYLREVENKKKNMLLKKRSRV